MSFNTFNQVTFEPGQEIFVEGQRGDAVFVIQQGEVEIYKVLDGMEVTITIFGPNNMFGEMAFLDAQPRSANARALTKVRCHKVEAMDFKQKLDALEPFMKGLFRVMASHIRNMNQRVADLETKPKV